MKDSIASSLRHSRSRAEKTYDRRTQHEKKTAALSLARKMAEESTTCAEPDGDLHTSIDVPRSERLHDPGDFVACIEEGSSRAKPRIHIGRVQYYVTKEKVSLLYYHAKLDIYYLKFTGSQWVEGEAACVPVKMEKTAPRHDTYILKSSIKEICARFPVSSFV